MSESLILELAVVVEGKVVSSNLPQFRAAVTAYVAAINRELKTDADFGQASNDVKNLERIEAGIKKCKAAALAQAETLHALFAELDEADDEARKVRLDLQALITTKTKQVKAALVSTALNQVNCAPHLRLKTFGSVVENAIKGKRTLASMEKALNEIVGSLNEKIDECQTIITGWQLDNGEIVPDAETLVLGNPDALRLELARRKQARDAAEEKKRQQAIIDEERNARIKAEAESEAKRLEYEARAAQTAPEPRLAPAPAQEPQAFAPVTPSPIKHDTAEADEMAAFQAVLQNAFAPVKHARAALKFPNNILRAQAFAAALGSAWNDLKGGQP